MASTFTVTCAGTTTVTPANAAIATATPPTLTLNVQAGAVVNADGANTISPSATVFNDAVSFNNAGTLGTAAAPVNFTYSGFNNPATNTLSITNGGMISGSVTGFAGGAMTAGNTGTIAGGLTLVGPGAITLTSSGPIYVANGGSGSTPVNLQSARSTTATTGTVGVNAASTTTFAGGIASATITAPVAIPAAGTAVAVPQGIFVSGVGGAQLNLDAVAGAVSLSTASYNNTSSVPGGGNTAVAGGVTTTNNASSTTYVGGAASATIGTNAQVNSVSVASGPGGSSASIAGKVGSATAPGSVSVTSTQADSSFTSTSTSAATGTTFTSTNRTTPVGGAVAIDLAATGQVFGTTFVSSNKGAATANVAGIAGTGAGVNVAILGDINVFSQGTSTVTTSNNSTTVAGSDFSNSTATTRAATGSTAGAMVASTGNVFGSLTVTGDTGATADNVGRVRDNVTVTSARLLNSVSNSNSQTTSGAAGSPTSVVSPIANTSVFNAVGGAAALTNRATGVIEDNVSVTGLTGATLTNAGAIFGNVSLTSAVSNSTNGTTNSTTTTTTPATAGGNTVQVVTTNASSSSSTQTGGAVVGTYGGTVGSASGSALTTGVRTVSQNGQTGSSAAISGTLFANFNGTAGAAGTTSSSTNTTTTTTQPFVAPATAASETVSTSQGRSATTWNAGDSGITVTGALRNNGFGTGSLVSQTGNGAASATVTGGAVEGSITVSGGTGSNTTNGNDTASRSTTAATTALPVAQSTAQSSSTTGFATSSGAAGSGAVTLTGATVAGAVAVSGRGTGAGGNTAATLTVASDSTVAGGVNVNTLTGGNVRTDNGDVTTRTGAVVTRTVSASSAETAPTNFGNATAMVAGRTGAITVNGNYGNASATLTGQSTGGVTVTANNTLSNSSSQQTYTGNNATTLAAPTQTGATSNGTTSNVGGTASLAINTAAALQATSTSATAGQLLVRGVGGSTLTIASGSRVNAGNAGNIFVGQTYTNSASQTTQTFATDGALSGQTTTSSTTAVGGAASLTNAGIVGASTGYFTAPLFVSVASVGGSGATNTGTIFGSVAANALGLNTSSTTTGTGSNDPVLTRTVTTTTNTGVGGAASVTNSGVISGQVTAQGATGTVTNSGVLRNGVSFGAAVNQVASTATTTATSSTTTVTAPATRFAQAYTLNQNGLLFGGVLVTGATIADPSTGAATGAVLRTSDIAATLNLNAGSITTGNIIAQVLPTDNSRLTNTTLRLNDSGYLGVGTSDTPSGALGAGIGALRFVNTPNYGAYVATDPALGTLTGTTFSPNLFVASGSAVRGVTLVEKTGAGIFTVVGTPYIATTVGGTPASYTMDVGTFRVSAGEVQLGVSGTDPVTGAGIFGIRGNVENNATLTLGRRVTDGSATVLQGIAVRVDGNVTQGATGTLALAAAPALVRANGTAVGPLVASGILGFGGYGVALTPFVAYDPTTTNSLRSTPSALTVNGNLTLAGAVSVTTSPGAIYTAGRAQDLFTVSGTYSATGLTLNSGFSSPFLTFALTPRTVGGTTIVSLDVTRSAYNRVATTSNAAAAADALQAAIPNLVTRIAAIRNPNTVADVQGYGRLQDLATVVSGLDTQLTAADAATAFNQLASGSFYGSLQAVSMTAPFGEATDQLPLTAPSGLELWFRPTGQFASIDGRASTGAARLRYDDYGGSAGFSVSSGTGGFFGIGGGYGRVRTRPVNYAAKATADTYMLGAFAGYRLGGVNLGAQAVFGWSNWDATRALPLFSRTASANFKSREFRFTARAAYDLAFGRAIASPFVKIDVRDYRFDAFDEDNAGGIGLAVGARSKTVFDPEAGVRLAGNFAGIQPFAEASYIFQSDTGAYRNVAYLGDTSTTFRLQGVDPKGHAKVGVGIQADVYGATVYLRGNYLTGGRVSTGEAQGGFILRF
ncbi:hypothetical protein [Sphingomonas bacterium]|uniref:hypothetical protein n=1 Tax=Sphingomonas bacterium TaxID=1895847 RepID=UPI0015753684|nr:hypothetical protein [Sphingomonas bacterium]